MAASTYLKGIRDALGYFHYVLLGFAMLFIILDYLVITFHSELRSFGSKISTVSFSKTDKVNESRHRAKLVQTCAINFQQRLLCVIILKSLLSVIFFCQFCYSYELAERKYIDDGKIFDSDAKLSSSHVIFMTMMTCAVTLSLQRVMEFFLFAYLKDWANDKQNFKLAGTKSSQKSARSGKSHKSYSSSSSSDGSTEASHRGEEDLNSTTDKVIESQWGYSLTDLA